MLKLYVPGREFFDEKSSRFISSPPAELVLEHSLLSVSNWESKWKKVFLDKSVPKTQEESIDYIRCMTLNKNVNPEVYSNIDRSTMQRINDYIEDNRTASWFSKKSSSSGGRSSEAITSELIYYWMIAHNIPFECQKWHLSRLLTLIRICNLKAEKPKKMPAHEAAVQRSMLNAKRRASMRSRG